MAPPDSLPDLDSGGAGGGTAWWAVLVVVLAGLGAIGTATMAITRRR